MPGNQTFVAGFAQSNLGDRAQHVRAVSSSLNPSNGHAASAHKASLPDSPTMACPRRRTPQRKKAVHSAAAEWYNRPDVSSCDRASHSLGERRMAQAPSDFVQGDNSTTQNAVRAQLISSGIIDNSAYVVVAGPANTYAHYITTREEYAIQRYEVREISQVRQRSTGNTLSEAYIDKYTSLVPFLTNTPTGTPASDAAPPELTSECDLSSGILPFFTIIWLLSLTQNIQTGVVFDAAPSGKSFGQVLVDVVKTTAYHAGSTVLAQFVGANPRNNLRLEGTFLSVDQLVGGAWKMVKTDSHPSTLYQWARTSTILGTSTVNISWTIESGTPAGTYRLRYFGDSKPLIGSISAFTGTSSNFTVS
ncbi:Neutral ceramidase [Mycena venus]|uniref:Neutral ceramidase n=1 Tax=Mycena venus TaxID=2733690 RepID=A0A8H6U0W2_9AGAR|nr:Neutral ceramidase [Mycena venus]